MNTLCFRLMALVSALGSLVAMAARADNTSAAAAMGTVTMSTETQMLTGLTPIGGPFTFQVSSEGRENDDLIATLEVWPTATQPCQRDTAFTSGDHRQHYILPLALSPSEKMLRTTVPTLQQGESFCFRVTRKANITSARAELLSNRFAQLLAVTLSSSKRQMDVVSDFKGWLAETIDQLAEVEHLNIKSKELIVKELDTALGLIALKIKDKQKAYVDKINEASKHEDEFVQKREELENLAREKPPKSNFLTFILLGSADVPKILGVDDVTVGELTSIQVKQVADQLRDRGWQVTDRLDARAWVKAADELEIAYNDSNATTRKEKLLKIIWPKLGEPVSIPLYLPMGITSKLVGLETMLTDTTGVFGSRATRQQAIAQLKAYTLYTPVGTNKGEALVRELDKLVSWITPFIAGLEVRETLSQRKTKDQASLKEAELARDAAVAELQAAAQKIFTNEAVRKTLIQSLESLSALANAATTPSASNYFAIDLGLAVAVPLSGGHHEPWLLPYLGLNLYTKAVDRSLPFRDMVGSTWRHRLSLTVGVTLNTVPAIPGRVISGPVLDRFPLVALGYRVAQYLRVVAGTTFYRLGDINPASAATSLGVAPFVALSADIDLISTFTTELGKYSKITP